jgi:hypothetical protein
MSSIMRRRNGLMASSVMGMLLSDVRLATLIFRQDAPIRILAQSPTARAVSPLNRRTSDQNDL